MATADITPAFVRNLNDEKGRIIRVDETPSDYISVHSVEYLEERAEDEDDNDWKQLSETFLEKDTETTFVWTGFSSVSCQGTTGGFPDAVAYRIDGDATEYTKDEILVLINEWEPSFSGYTYWDGHNWSFQHTSDEQGNWVPLQLVLHEVSAYQTFGRSYTLYAGLASVKQPVAVSGEENAFEIEEKFYIGQRRAGGEQLHEVTAEELVAEYGEAAKGGYFDVPTLAIEVAEALLRYPNELDMNQAASFVEAVEHNPFQHDSLAMIAERLTEMGDESSEQDLRDDFRKHGTLL